MSDTDETKIYRRSKLVRRKLLPEEEKLIKDYYAEGHTYKEIVEKYGYSMGTIARLVRGSRTLSESRKLSISRGRFRLTADGRQRLSDLGKKACQRSGKVYTKPERLFKNILNSVGIGVKFPEILKEKFNIQDDNDEQYLRYIYFQYPLQRYVLDFVDVDNKVAININGDYWHANPILYDHNKLGRIQSHNVRTDKNKRVFLEKLGWRVLDIWGSEVEWCVDLVLDKLRVAGIMEARRDYTAEDVVRFPGYLPEDWSDRLTELWNKRYSAAGHTEKPKSKGKQGTCRHCGYVFSYRSSRTHKYCSVSCYNAHQVIFSATADEVLDKIRELGSYKRVGEYFGVSDTTIRKHCCKLGIISQVSDLLCKSKSEKARKRHQDNPDRLRKANKRSSEARSARVPYFVASDKNTGKELHRFSTYAELKLSGFHVEMVLRACTGKLKTYKGMLWSRENKIK